MEANRYFEEMHKAMAAQKAASELLLCVKYQDAAGNDAYIELRRDAAKRTARVFYSTMGRKHLNFQLFRTGWQLCHNESGKMTGSFPQSAESMIQHTDFHAFYREEAFDSEKAARIERELELCSGMHVERVPAEARRCGSFVTVESFVGTGAYWCYGGAPDAACMSAAAIVYWLAEYLAGGERRALQASAQAAHIASQWETEQEFAKVKPLSFAPRAQSRGHVPPARQPQRRPAQNERCWQSILAVMSAV